jgi:heptosyltransferase-3
MRILFITSSRIGDAVLSTGLLDYIVQTWPNASVTIACGPLATSLFEGYPQLERVIAVKKEKRNAHWLKLWKQVASTQWDIVIDLRNSAVSRLIWADQRFIFGGHIDGEAHKAVQNAAVMKLKTVPAPKLWFSAAQAEKADALMNGTGKILGIGPTANWIGKTWPTERFIEIIDFMTGPGGVMQGARVAVFAAPGEETEAYTVLHSVPPERQIDGIAKGTPGEAAAAIARCDFYLGNDSGLMHCAAASGVRTLGLFGPSYDHIYAPYGDHCAFIRTPESFDDLIDFPGYDPKTLDHTLMESLSVDTVKAKITKIFAKA